MSKLERLKQWVRQKLGRKVEPLIERSIIVGYYNGLCPLCKTHIGIDIYKDNLTGQVFANCANCNKEIYEKLENQS